MGLKVYNTLYRKKQDFVPVYDGRVRMYVCGPTVYNYISIGNTRPIVVFDMMRNYLEHTGYKVDFIQNITDIEDKIIKKANEEGVSFSVITERYIKAFMDDIKMLQVGTFTAMPKASEMISEIVSIISRIIENGYAYQSDGDVYFDVLKFKGYGKLSGQNIDEMQTQEDDNLSKKSRIDFTLWKKAKEGEPCWDSPWGKGRPGWHIECSAMSLKYLDYGLDIHGGGLDLVFPHHENEIAQSEAAFPEKGDFVRYWLHNGMIEVKEEKMSKSKGLLDDWILRNLLKKFSANVIKMYILSTHYRSPLEFSLEKIEEAKKALEKIINFLINIKFIMEYASKSTPESITNTALKSAFNDNDEIEPDRTASLFYDYLKDFKSEFKSSMDDDFNSAKAIGNMFDFIGEVNTIIQNPKFRISKPSLESLRLVYEVVTDYGKIFGFDFKSELCNEKKFASGKIFLDSSEIEELIIMRNKARKNKDFARADEIRERLKSFGIILYDRKEGTIWKRET
ncbi:MAG: cysteine--tRNA ligase [Actinobacteria bacterium]|nr:cysteine--tRNA ligase [Actinomycetota bacterium]MBM3712420.1 cysteine--tRNA ligase [Actinomycetota bacterium]